MKYLQVLKKIGIPLFLLTVVGTSLDQMITVKMENLLMDPSGTSPWVWLYGAFSLVLNLVYPLALVFLVLAVHRGESIPKFFKTYFVQGIIEQMRSWGKAMLWSFLLIIPGIVKFVQYLFVPFVVCFDPNYQRGEVDALKRSQQISQGYFIRLFLLFLLFTLVVPGAMTVFDEWKLIWSTPGPALLICFLEMLLNLCFIQILWRIFNRRALA